MDVNLSKWARKQTKETLLKLIDKIIYETANGRRIVEQGKAMIEADEMDETFDKEDKAFKEYCEANEECQNIINQACKRVGKDKVNLLELTKEELAKLEKATTKRSNAWDRYQKYSNKISKM